MVTEQKQGTVDEEQGTQPAPPEGKSEAPDSEDTQATARTYTEEDFQRAVSKATQSKDKQLGMKASEAKKFQSEAEAANAELLTLNTDLEDMRKQIDELSEQRFSDDPDALNAYRSKRELDRQRADLKKREAEAEKKLYDAEMLAWSTRMAQKAAELHQETGVPVDDLKNCATEDEMEAKALRWEKQQKNQPPSDPDTPTFATTDTGAGRGGARTLEERVDARLRRLQTQSHR